MRNEGYGSCFVCLSVCLSPTILALQATRARKINGDFAETTAFERYGVKTSENANMHNELWLTSTRFSPFSTPWTNQFTKGYTCISKSSAALNTLIITQLASL